MLLSNVATSSSLWSPRLQHQIQFEAGTAITAFQLLGSCTRIVRRDWQLIFPYIYTSSMFTEHLLWPGSSPGSSTTPERAIYIS